MIFRSCGCNYCTKYKFPILWNISKKNYWYEIPKNGSWSIKNRYKIRKVKDVAPVGSVIYIVWRDPIERFKSLFMHYFLEEGGRYVLAEEFFAKRGRTLKSYNIQERISLCLSFLEEFDSTMEVHHFYPQTYFLDTRFSDNFKIISIKDLSKELNTKTLNVTSKKRSSGIKFTEEQLNLIRDIYRSDYEFMQGTH